jgi:hypothetical protein
MVVQIAQHKAKTIGGIMRENLTSYINYRLRL